MAENSEIQNDAEWRVYILACADGSLYTGIARDVEARLARHRAGKGARYLRGRLPFDLIYEEQAADRGAALRREAAIKRLSRPAKLALIAQASGTL